MRDKPEVTLEGISMDSFSKKELDVFFPNSVEVLGIIVKSKEYERERILKIIRNQLEELNKKENYSLDGKRKLCCQVQLSILRDALLRISEQKEHNFGMGIEHIEKEKEVVKE